MTDKRVVLRYQDEKPQRLDKFLVSRLPDFSRSRLQSFIKTGNVWVNGELAKKAGQTLESDTEVEVLLPPPEPSQLTPESIPLEVVFENQDLLVINKPSGMVVHPSAGHTSGTLVQAVLAYAPDIQGVGGETRPGVVHRLDKDTSGLILLAKNDASHRWLQNQFKARKAIKTYLALVDGAPPTRQGRVEAAIGRDLASRKKMAIASPEKGRLAISEYKTVEHFTDHTLLEIHPITGRTHQIRLHMAFLGCPIAGDRVYGRRRPTVELDRHFLHAARLTIRLPGEIDPKTFEAPFPLELEATLQSLR